MDFGLISNLACSSKTGYPLRESSNVPRILSRAARREDDSQKFQSRRTGVTDLHDDAARRQKILQSQLTGGDDNDSPQPDPKLRTAVTNHQTTITNPMPVKINQGPAPVKVPVPVVVEFNQPEHDDGEDPDSDDLMRQRVTDQLTVAVNRTSPIFRILNKEHLIPEFEKIHLDRLCSEKFQQDWDRIMERAEKEVIRNVWTLKRKRGELGPSLSKAYSGKSPGQRKESVAVKRRRNDSELQNARPGSLA